MERRFCVNVIVDESVSVKGHGAGVDLLSFHGEYLVREIREELASEISVGKKIRLGY